MSDVEAKRPELMSRGQIILKWWRHNIEDRQMAHARALSARLRRAGPLDVLGEAAVHELSRALNLRDAAGLIRLVQVLAEVRELSGQPLASVLGMGEPPAMSSFRFQRLMRVETEELATALRRAVVMADRKCNVAVLGWDALHWDEKTRHRWCFQYFGTPVPDALKGADVMDQEISQ